jgi:ABC-type cobalamin/Fe3+-siderophores transport system ATPase subunit
MTPENSDKLLLLQQFEVKGYKNLTQIITFGPLGRINVIHGENNVGKSNLLEAMWLFFRLVNKISLGSGLELPSKRFQEITHVSATDVFNLIEPLPIELTGHFVISIDRLRRAGIGPPHLSTDPVTIRLMLTRMPSGVRLQIKEFSFGGIDAVYEDEPVKLGNETFDPRWFASQVASVLAQAYTPQVEQKANRFILIGSHRHTYAETLSPSSLQIVPQSLRDALFDAKESLEVTMIRRWELFVEAMQQFEPILGPGRFETAFYRQSSQADLVFDSGDMRVPVYLLGSGVQQIVALLGQLLMTPATLVSIEEPELNLRYTLQKQLLKAFQEITASEHGPEQLFLTSHSPAFEAEEHFFAMEMVDGTPTLSRRPRALARIYTGTRDEEDLYPEMHARRSEPVCYVSSEGLVLLPDDVRQQLKVEQGGGVSFVPNQETGRFEIWTTDEVERWLTGDDRDADDA